MFRNQFYVALPSFHLLQRSAFTVGRPLNCIPSKAPLHERVAAWTWTGAPASEKGHHRMSWRRKARREKLKYLFSFLIRMPIVLHSDVVPRCFSQNRCTRVGECFAIWCLTEFLILLNSIWQNKSLSVICQIKNSIVSLMIMSIFTIQLFNVET